MHPLRLGAEVLVVHRAGGSEREGQGEEGAAHRGPHPSALSLSPPNQGDACGIAQGRTSDQAQREETCFPTQRLLGIMQWTPLRTSTTWLTRQSTAIAVSA
jgi:hypothetical protein